MTTSRNRTGSERPAFFVQAPVEPLDADGTKVSLTGTVGFVIATIILGIQFELLRDAGHTWYLWVAICGTVFGVGFSVWTWARKRRRLREASAA